MATVLWHAGLALSIGIALELVALALLLGALSGYPLLLVTSWEGPVEVALLVVVIGQAYWVRHWVQVALDARRGGA